MKFQKWSVISLIVVLFLGLMIYCSTQAGQLTVTFYSNDGTVLKVDNVKKRSAAVPPEEPQMSYGTVFQSWDTDFSRVTQNLEVYPICEDVKGKVNAFTIASAYGKTDETVKVLVSLCGDVCVAGFDATITYDPEVLELSEVTEDGAVLYNNETPGKLRLNYVSVENTEADVDICRLQFRIKAENGVVPVNMELHNIYACNSNVDSQDDSMYVPESYLINGNIHVIP